MTTGGVSSGFSAGDDSTAFSNSPRSGLAPRSSGMLKERLGNAVSFLESLGSVVDVTEKKGKVVIKGYGCPITGGVEADGRLCIAMAVMISKLVGIPATEKCNRDDQPSCCFEIKLP